MKKQISYFIGTDRSSKKITPQDQDFPRWYQDVVEAADLAEHGPSKGSMIIKPYGYAIWEGIQQELSQRIYAAGVPNMYFPIFIPESYLHREAKHVEGFAPEVAVVTHAGGKKLDEPLVVRPTSETIMYESFSRWINSYRDLPFKINQWANVVRWEMRPRLFLRSTEFLWQEGHTAHASVKEADGFAREVLEFYQDLMTNVLAIATIDGEKSVAERFAGAKATYTLEAMMKDGKALQIATSHNLGDNFSKAFNVQYSAEDGSQKYVGQTSWGVSTRSIGGLIMAHGDDKGLVLPPKLAPIKAVIMTVNADGNVQKTAQQVADSLGALGNVELDDRDARIGEKAFAWEKRGAPIRIEIGPRDVESKSVVVVRRDTSEKASVKLDDLKNHCEKLLGHIQANLLKSSQDQLTSNTVPVKDEKELVEAVEQGKFASADFEIDDKKETELKAKHGITVRCYPFDDPDKTILAKAY
ncbi:proline--tRNA ligase [Candidatus Saccharibacteria bacterium]|nr:proline--tRNA ligase [Candidatus Saccharibacteria bacterium]